jgi:hypothetical protein
LGKAGEGGLQSGGVKGQSEASAHNKDFLYNRECRKIILKEKTQMVELISSILNPLFQGIGLGRRWLMMIILLSFTIVLLIVYDNYTDNTYYSKLERQIEILSKLKELSDEGIETNPDLYAKYKEILEAVEFRNTRITTIPSLLFTWDITSIIKFILGGLLFFVVALWGMFTQNIPNRFGFGAAIMIIGIILGFIALALPEIFGNPWITPFGFLVAQILIATQLSKPKQSLVSDSNNTTTQPPA